MKTKYKVLGAAVLNGLVLLASQPNAYAIRHSRGGDPNALEFQQCADIAIQEIKSNIQEFPKTKDLDLNTILLHATVLISNEPLFGTENGTKQELTAINQQNTITINRARWTSIQNVTIKNAIALHEILSLAGVESTGDYSISQIYLNLRGIQCDPDHCTSEQNHSSVFDFDEAQNAFIGANPPTLSELPGNWLMIGFTTQPESHEPARYSENGVIAADGMTRHLVFKVSTGVSNEHEITVSDGGAYPPYCSGPYPAIMQPYGVRFTENSLSIECRSLKNENLLCDQVFAATSDQQLTYTLYRRVPQP